MALTKYFSITLDPVQLPDFGSQALEMVMRAALEDEKEPLLLIVRAVDIKGNPIKESISSDVLPTDGTTEDFKNTTVSAVNGDDVAARNKQLMEKRGVQGTMREKISKSTQVSGPAAEPREIPELKPTGEATPHVAPGGAGKLCANPKRERVSIQGTGSIEFCASCGYQYRDSDLGRK